MLILIENNTQIYSYKSRDSRKSWVDSFSSNNSFEKEEKKEKVLKQNEKLLKNCSFFYNFDGETSTTLLTPTPPGTFLIRPSSSSSNLYTLSINTKKGPTSVRLVFENLRFRLDAADQRLVSVLPSFDNVLSLVEYYVKNSGKEEKKCLGG